jgi:RNA polymerase sigma factor (sigma-70 family)
MKKPSSGVPESTDEEIIKKILTGHAVWFEILIRRYNSSLYKIARGYGFNQQDAEDLIQDAHFTAYTQLKKLEHPDSYKTWISKILINNCIYKLAHGYFKYEYPKVIDERDRPIHLKEKKDSTEDIIANRELSLIIENCLQSIPIIYKSVFILREIEGFNVAETSEILGISHNNVKVRLSRARQLLKKEIEKYYSVKDLFDFKDVYCDEIVKNVFEKISNTLKKIKPNSV